jgi:prepilin-type N-terminal cleavage/methylation domain-containing protein
MKQKGFTLIELLIVIAILGCIAAVVFLNIGDFFSRGHTHDIILEPPSIADAPYQVLIITGFNMSTPYINSPLIIQRYCPEGGYKLMDGCVLFTKSYVLYYNTNGQIQPADVPDVIYDYANNQTLPEWHYSETTEMFCDKYVQRVVVIDRRGQ